MPRMVYFLFRLDLPAPRDSNISEESADEGFDDTDYLDENGKPREVRQSVGPFPNDRKFSTATQEAVYIYQASARAAGKIHDDHIKQHQQEGENYKGSGIRLQLKFSPTHSPYWNWSPSLEKANIPTLHSRFGKFSIDYG